MHNRHQTPTGVSQFAKDNRKQMTRAEVLLWGRLRRQGLDGLRFRRQEPIGPFIADFYCAAHRLIVELDGSSHEGRDAHDALRDEIMRNEGYEVLRFTNFDVERNIDAVLSTIAAHCGLDA